MTNYAKPQLFKPTLQEQKEVASKLSKLFSSNVGVKLSDGSVVPGERDKLRKSN